MKKEDFFEILGDVNDQFIEEAHMQNENNNKITWKKWGAIAACLMVAALSVTLANRVLTVKDDPTDAVKPTSFRTDETLLQNDADESAVMQEESKTSSDILNDSKDPTAVQEVEEKNTLLQKRIEDLSSGDSLGWIVYENRIYMQDFNIDIDSLENNQNQLKLSESLGRPSDFQGFYQNAGEIDGDVYLVIEHPDIICIKLANGATIWLGVEDDTSSNSDRADNDIPADVNGNYYDAIRSDSLEGSISDFYGGSYTDSNGRFTVVLVQDTPASRDAICNELGISENDTVFVEGKYTLKYLTELQNKISTAMQDKELPFVTASRVDEISNCIRISVTTGDETQLKKIHQFDDIGGAIKVDYVSGEIIEE